MERSKSLGNRLMYNGMVLGHFYFASINTSPVDVGFVTTFLINWIFFLLAVVSVAIVQLGSLKISH